MNTQPALLVFAACVAGCAATTFIERLFRLAIPYSKKVRAPGAASGQQILLLEATSYRNGTVLFSNEHTGIPAKVAIGAGQVNPGS